MMVSLMAWWPALHKEASVPQGAHNVSPRLRGKLATASNVSRAVSDGCDITHMYGQQNKFPSLDIIPSVERYAPLGFQKSL